MPEMPLPPGSPSPMLGNPRVPAPGPTAPAAVSVQNKGLRMQGLVLAGVAVKALEKSVASVGAATEEGQAILKALTILSKIVPQPNAELAGAEVKSLAAKAPAMSPMQPAATRESVMERLRGLGLGQKPTAPVAGAA